MKLAMIFTALLVGLAYLAMLPAGVMPKPYGLYLSIPLLFASIFVSFSITASIHDGRLESFSDLKAAFAEGASQFLSWSLYMAVMLSITGLVFLIAQFS